MKVLELESQLENERLRLGELRKKHYDLAGVPLDQVSEGNGETSSLDHPVSMSPKPTKPTLMKKPALAQKPNIPPKTSVRASNTKTVYRNSLKICLLMSFFVFSSLSKILS